MKLELEVYGALCATSKFKINGIEANKSDFGEQYDTEPEVAEDYACGNMQFIPAMATKEALEKYKITAQEYEKICEKLKEKLSFGSCGWCV